MISDVCECGHPKGVHWLEAMQLHNCCIIPCACTSFTSAKPPAPVTFVQDVAAKVAARPEWQRGAIDRPANVSVMSPAPEKVEAVCVVCDGIGRVCAKHMPAPAEPEWLDGKPSGPGVWVRRAKDGIGGYDTYDITRDQWQSTQWSGGYWWMRIPEAPATTPKLPTSKTVTLTAKVRRDGKHWIAEVMAAGSCVGKSDYHDYSSYCIKWVRNTFGIEPEVES